MQNHITIKQSYIKLKEKLKTIKNKMNDNHKLVIETFAVFLIVSLYLIIMQSFWDKV